MSSRTTSRLSELRPYALFFALVCIFLWRPIFKGEALLPGDYLAQMAPWNAVIKSADPAPQWNPLQWDAIAQFYPWRVLYARSILSGHLPLWNPNQFCGAPFVANGQSAVFYPPNLIFLVFDTITGFTIFAVLHLFMAQAFTYLLLRALGCRELGGIVGAITFGFSAFVVLWLELPTFVSVAVWLPLVLLLIYRAVERKSVPYGAFSGAVLALSFLAGHLQIAFYVALASALWWLWLLGGVWRSEGRGAVVKRVALPVVAFIVIAALVPAVQLLPSMELGAHSHRVRAANAEGYGRFVGNAVKPYRLVTAFAPDYYGNPSKNDYYLLGPLPDGSICTAADYMEYGMYAGILPLLLAGFGLAGIRKRRHLGFFAFLGLLALLIALGTILNAPFYYLIPGFSAFGGPNRILLLYVFSIAALAGFGADAIFVRLRHPTDAHSHHGSDAAKPVVVGMVLGSAFALFLVANYFAQKQAVTPMIPQTIGDELAPLRFGADKSVAMAAASVLTLCLALYRPQWRRLIPALMVSVVIVDLFSFGINYNPTCSREKVYPQTALTDVLSGMPDGTRIAAINSHWDLWDTPKAVMPPNSSIVYNLCDVGGYDSLFPMSYKKLADDVEGEDSSPPENGNLLLVRQYTHRLGELADVVVSAEPLSAPELDEVGVYNAVHVYAVENSGVRRTVSDIWQIPRSFRLGSSLSIVGLCGLALAVAGHFVVRGKRN